MILWVRFSRIEVAVRKRPINDREVNRGDRDIITCPNDASSIFVHEPKFRRDEFSCYGHT